MKRLDEYLLLDPLLEQSPGEKKEYFHPKRKNLGVVSLVLLREAIAPVVFRNAEQEITDIDFAGEVYIRAVPNKFKYPERGRGLQILRALEAGGRYPQNRTVIPKHENPSHAFDLNTVVFGDSANHANKVLPVRAAVNYSDGLSLLPKYQCVDETFHNRAAEDGTLFDAEREENSTNIFSRHFIRPGTLLVQVLSTRGKVLPPTGLRHLLLSVGLAGSYGGQTSVTGTNIQTHFVGCYADRFEQAITSPYELIRKLDEPSNELPAMRTALHEFLAPLHRTAIPGAEVSAWVQDLVDRFDRDDGALKKEYQETAAKVAELFDAWFGK